MTREKDPECRGILVSETPNAICVRASNKTALHWIPRSQIGYMRKQPASGGGTEVVFTCPEWLLEKGQMWELVP